MKQKPSWLRVSLKQGDGFAHVTGILKAHRLNTVCEEADCPNIHECYGARTATFLIMGDICTRSCRFCAVTTGKPAPLDPDEPNRIAEAVKDLGLKHVVLTSVDRDDLPDGGAAHFSATVRAIRARWPECRIEVLTPDFNGDEALLAQVFESRPDVYGFNMETVGALHQAIRPAVSYETSLQVLRLARSAQSDHGFLVKSGFMVGLGETDEQILATLKDLAAIPCDIVTIGQYLAPTRSHAPVARYVTPEAFAQWKETGEQLGIRTVFAGPLVRSSYHADRQAGSTLDR